jgi:hypothetical protein
MPSTIGLPLLLLLLTVRKVNPDGLIRTGGEKLDQQRLPVLATAHAVVWPGTKSGDTWLLPNR